MDIKIKNDFLLQLFVGFNDKEINEILKLGQHKEYKAGEVILYEGEMGTAIYVVEKGEVNIIKKNRITNEAVLLNTISEGNFFGEMSTIDVHPRAATVVTKNDVKVLVFDIDVLKNFFRDKPELFSLFIMNIARVISKRLRGLEDELARYSSIEHYKLEKQDINSKSDSTQLIEQVLNADITVQVQLWQKLTEKLSAFEI